jgi:tRNA-2-methylthio-N6-dimethylallyladenosine synthase
MINRGPDAGGVLCYLESYGCQMNVNDSDILVSRLRREGYAVTSAPDRADVILLNTCSVRERAEERVVGRLWDLSRFRTRGRLRVLGVMGCMAQRLGEGVFDLCHEVDLVAGTRAFTRIPSHLETLLAGGGRVTDLETAEVMPRIDVGAHPPTSDTAFVSIMRGCNRACTYCIVPSLRGPEVYRGTAEILDEVRALVAHRVREIVLLGQNVNSWREGRRRFGDLLRSVNAVDGLERIRFTTPHPRDFDDDCLRAVAGCEKVCEHLHLPAQSGSNTVLARMVRGYKVERYLGIVESARRLIPDVALTTDLIVGFPGESRAEFEETLDLVRRVEYDAAFTFKYSPRDGTKAAEMEDDVAAEEKNARLMELNSVVKTLADRKNATLVGRVVPVVLEQIQNADRGVVKGRTRTNKSVLVEAPSRLLGSVQHVRIVRARGLILHGELGAAA